MSVNPSWLDMKLECELKGHQWLWNFKLREGSFPALMTMKIKVIMMMMMISGGAEGLRVPDDLVSEGESYPPGSSGHLRQSEGDSSWLLSELESCTAAPPVTANTAITAAHLQNILPLLSTNVIHPPQYGYLYYLHLHYEATQCLPFAIDSVANVNKSFRHLLGPVLQRKLARVSPPL